ncbi:hypothetical protein KCP74_01685 [Salmonella enterica subsp. enterica]|nr:hypothetical protein KCP74_01685 [Salmonella enterica subsp. enterica]
MLLLALWLHKQGLAQPKQVTHAVIHSAQFTRRQQYRQRRQPVTEKYDFESFDMPLDVAGGGQAQQVMPRYLEGIARLRPASRFWWIWDVRPFIVILIQRFPRR